MNGDESHGFATVCEIALAFPRASKTRYYGMPALKVDGEAFVVCTKHRSAEPNSISVVVGYNRRDELIADKPGVFYVKRHYEPYPVVLVRLDSIKREDLHRLLRSAYDAVSSGSVSASQRRGTHRPKGSPKIIRRKRSR